jgi:hypothetical protein
MPQSQEGIYRISAEEPMHWCVPRSTKCQADEPFLLNFSAEAGEETRKKAKGEMCPGDTLHLQRCAMPPPKHFCSIHASEIRRGGDDAPFALILGSVHLLGGAPIPTAAEMLRFRDPEMPRWIIFPPHLQTLRNAGRIPRDVPIFLALLVASRRFSRARPGQCPGVLQYPMQMSQRRCSSDAPEMLQRCSRDAQEVLWIFARHSPEMRQMGSIENITMKQESLECGA